MELLLISNSTGPDGGYLDHCEEALVEFLDGAGSVLFIPFAGGDESAYGERTCRRLRRMGIRATWANRADDPLTLLENTDSVFVGGGNTFRLLDRLYSTGLLKPLKRLANEGLPYVGASAGTNVAGPTIKTTNDMPIVEPPSFTALGLVRFQVNPHYVDRDPDSKHQGETREQRLNEYLEENDRPVVALREGAILGVRNNDVSVQGSAGVRVYRRDRAPLEVPSGSRLDIPTG